MTIPLVPPAGTSTPPVGRAFLVTSRTPPIVHNAVQECDARLAVCRGLAEYLAGVSINAEGGRKVAFKQVHEEYAEPEESANYPAVKIGLRGPGVYEARSLSPSIDPSERVPQPDGRYLIVPCDFASDLGVEVWTTDPEERSAAIIALERAFTPNFNKFGFDIQLPYYFNCRATYSMTELAVDDDAESVHRRFRVATITLKVRVPFVTLFSFPDARPSFDLQAVGDGADVLVNLEVL
jgi:hypothetical protein